MRFRGYSTSIRGHSHEIRSLPLQDASATRCASGYSIAAVSDGHGGASYFRSDIGANLAVASALDVVSDCMSDPEFIRELRRGPCSVMRRLTDCILSAWTDAVKEYDEGHPLTEEECCRSADLGAEGSERDLLRRYGATLVCGVLSDEAMFGFQIGDGTLVVVDEGGGKIMPVPQDPDCFLNVTTSMCGSAASDRFRHVVMMSGVRASENPGTSVLEVRPRSIASLTASTDGFTTSFNSDDSIMRYCSLIPSISASVPGLRSLEDNLRQRSRSNTEDDVSVASVWRFEPIEDRAARRRKRNGRRGAYRRKRRRRLRMRPSRREQMSRRRDRCASVRATKLEKPPH